MKKEIVAFSTIIFAFSSLIYELSFSSLFSFLYGSTVEMYSLVIGIYLFALGIGGFLFYKLKSLKKSILETLIFVEIGIIFSVFLGIIILIKIFDYFFVSKLIGLFFVFLIGIFSGFEIPLLTKLYSKKESFALILSLDYFGSLIAGVTFPLFFYPKFGIIGTLIFALTLNILTTTALFVSFKKINKLKEKLILAVLLFLDLILVLSLAYYKQIQNFTIKHFITELIKMDMDYWALSKLGQVKIDIKNLTYSPYQVIYFFEMKLKNYSSYCLGLNGITQTCTSNYLAHHFAYLVPFLINKKIKKNYEILILGGGDGILANELIKFSKKYGLNFNITQIELDKKVIESCKKDEIFRKLNNNSFSKVNLIIGDAFREMIKLKLKNKKFDAILDDLDVSNWDNKIKFLSLEYFNLIKSLLKKDGFYVIPSLNIKTSYPLDDKTFVFFKTINTSFKYELYYVVQYDSFKKGNLIVTPYENAFILTDKPFNLSLINSYKFHNKTLLINYEDEKFIPISEIANFYSKIYKKRENSFFWPEYSILKI